jgi:hypothetical protein
MPGMRDRGVERLTTLQKKLAALNDQISIEKDAQDILPEDENPTIQYWKRLKEAAEKKIAASKEYVQKVVSDSALKVAELEKSISGYNEKLAALTSEERQPTSIYYRKLVSRAEALKLEIKAVQKLYKLETESSVPEKSLEKKFSTHTHPPRGGCVSSGEEKSQTLSETENRNTILETSPKTLLASFTGKRDWKKHPPTTEQELEAWEAEMRVEAEQRWKKEEQLYNSGFQH